MASILKPMLLTRFINRVREQFPDILIWADYDVDEGMFRISHTYEAGYTDIEFNTAIGKLITELFVPNEFFDYYIEYIPQNRGLAGIDCPAMRRQDGGSTPPSSTNNLTRTNAINNTGGA